MKLKYIGPDRPQGYSITDKVKFHRTGQVINVEGLEESDFNPWVFKGTRPMLEILPDDYVVPETPKSEQKADAPVKKRRGRPPKLKTVTTEAK